MIIIARIIEAWRDARIFEFPTESRGRLWHLLKYPQYGLLIGSSLTYYMLLLFVWGIWNILVTVLVIAVDAGLAYFVFEWFLPFFRKRMRQLATAKKILQ